MEIIDALKEKFQVWLMIQRDKVLSKQLAKVYSDNPDDYFFNPATQQFVYKDSSLNVQIGWENTLNVVKTKIETLNLSVENLEAIIDDIAQVNIDTSNLQAIIADIANIETLNTTISGNIGTMNTNITNLQAIITDIATIETLNATISGNITSLTAIIADIGTMDVNINNLQAIIADIANIETLNATISGNITSLTAIIANIGTMNTNITNLQAIITDIANIETQNISMSSSLATINANIGTINTAITNIEAHEADIDINIASVNDLNIEVINQVNKGEMREGILTDTSVSTISFDTTLYLFNRLSITAYNLTNNDDVNINVKISNYIVDKFQVIYDNDLIGDYGVLTTFVISFGVNPHIKIQITNNTGQSIKFKYVLFFSKKILESEISLASLAEKSYNSLTDKPSLNLNDLPEKSYNSLTDKPSIPDAPDGLALVISIRGGNGFVAGVTYTAVYQVACSDTSAYLIYTFYVRFSGTYSVKILYSTNLANVGKVASGIIYISDNTAPSPMSWDKASGVNCDLVLGTQTVLYRKTYGNVVLSSESTIGVQWTKNDNAGGASGNLRIHAIILQKV